MMSEGIPKKLNCLVCGKKCEKVYGLYFSFPDSKGEKEGVLCPECQVAGAIWTAKQALKEKKNGKSSRKSSRRIAR